jgi:hypothetical protein
VWGWGEGMLVTVFDAVKCTCAGERSDGTKRACCSPYPSFLPLLVLLLPHGCHVQRACLATSVFQSSVAVWALTIKGSPSTAYHSVCYTVFNLWLDSIYLVLSCVLPTLLSICDHMLVAIWLAQSYL